MTIEEIRKHFKIQKSKYPDSDIRLRCQKVGDKIIIDLAILAQVSPGQFYDHHSNWELSLHDLETNPEVYLKEGQLWK